MHSSVGADDGDDLMDTERVRILVVDDEELIRALLSELFTAEGYEVTTAVDGEQALELLGTERFDLVLTDLIMPGLDGVEVLLHAKRIDADRPVVVMTGHAPVDTVSRLTESGADDYITKPFDLEDVKEIVARLIEMGRGTGQLHEGPLDP